MVKPNLLEAGEALNRRLTCLTSIEEAGKRLLDVLQSDAVIITRGAEGMSLFQPGTEAEHIPTHAREIYDVTGAGDTVASTLAMSLAVRASFEQAARLASRAAGIIVGKMGTAAVTLEDLLITRAVRNRRVRANENEIADREWQLDPQAAKREKGRNATAVR